MRNYLDTLSKCLQHTRKQYNWLIAALIAPGTAYFIGAITIIAELLPLTPSKLDALKQDIVFRYTTALLVLVVLPCIITALIQPAPWNASLLTFMTTMLYLIATIRLVPNPEDLK